MRVRKLSCMTGVAIASITVLGAVMPSSAQVVVVASACTATTETFVQPVGSPRAPVLVPMNVPVTECTLSRNVRVIIPAFRVVGMPPASVIVPSGLPVTSCAVGLGTVPTSPISGVQVVTVSGPTVTVVSPAAVVALPVTCF